MSLPTNDYMRHDCILKHLDGLIDCYENTQAYLEAYPDVGLIWESKLQDIRQYMQQIDDYIKRGELHTVGSHELSQWVRALDHLFFDDLIFAYCAGLDMFWLNVAADSDSQLLGFFGIKAGRTVFGFCPQKHHNAVELIGTILHELVHAFIWQFARFEGVEKKTSTNEDAFNVFRKLDGATGHAFYFQKLARAVEDRAREVLGNEKIILGRLNAVVAEYRTTREIPSEAYFEEMLKAPRYSNQSFPKPARDWLVRCDEEERLKQEETTAQASNQAGG